MGLMDHLIGLSDDEIKRLIDADQQYNRDTFNKPAAQPPSAARTALDPMSMTTTSQPGLLGRIGGVLGQLKKSYQENTIPEDLRQGLRARGLPGGVADVSSYLAELHPGVAVPEAVSAFAADPTNAWSALNVLTSFIPGAKVAKSAVKLGGDDASATPIEKPGYPKRSSYPKEGWAEYQKRVDAYRAEHPEAFLPDNPPVAKEAPTAAPAPKAPEPPPGYPKRWQYKAAGSAAYEKAVADYKAANPQYFPLTMPQPDAQPPVPPPAGVLGEVADDVAKATPAGGVLGEVAKPGRKEAITAVSLRNMDPEEALKIAQSGRHIIKSKRGYSGAPDNVQNMDDLQKMRDNFDAQVEAGLVGANWYGRTQDWVKKMSGSDPKEQSRTAHGLGTFSSQATPDTNLGFYNRSQNAAIMDMPVKISHTGKQARDFQRAFEAGELSPTGKKTGIFARTMDPTEFSPTTGTNDIWHARAFGFTNPKTGKPWDAALTDQQHAFLDAETVLAVGRANAKGLGGRNNWTAGEIQAAPWVAMKGRSLMEKFNKTKAVKSGKTPPMTLADGMEEAKKTFPDFEGKYTGFANYETTPGRTTGHLSGIEAGDEALRQRFADDPKSSWEGENRRDDLYASQKARVAPTEDIVGIYGGKTNPGKSARPQVAYEGKSGKRVLDEASKQLMGGTEANRAFWDVQDAGSSIAMLPGQQTGHSNAYRLKLPKDMQDAEGLLGVMRKAQDVYPGSEIVDFGKGDAMLTQFGADPGLPNKQRTAVKGLLGEMGVESEPIRREGDLAPGYPGYDWSKPGSDTATKQLLAAVNPAQRKAFENPVNRRHVLDRMERDDAFAAEGHGVARKDIQFARKTFFEKGFAGLEAALGKGLLPAAAAAIFLPYLSGGEEEGT